MPDAFDQLRLPPTFDLPRDRVERAYLAQAAALHPDLSGLDEETALLRSAELNKARESLNAVPSRARLLLNRFAPNALIDKSLPPGFLMQVMEQREEIDTVTGAHTDTAGLAEERARLSRGVADQITAIDQRLADLFRQFQSQTMASADLASAVHRELNARRYFERMEEQLAGRSGID